MTPEEAAEFANTISTCLDTALALFGDQLYFKKKEEPVGLAPEDRVTFWIKQFAAILPYIRLRGLKDRVCAVEDSRLQPIKRWFNRSG
jgi:hypothetical protein